MYPYKLREGLILVASVWFNNIGIVLVEDEYVGCYKAYIKSIEDRLYAFDKPEELQDAIYISEFGNTFPLNAAKELFPQFFSGCC